MEVEIVTFVVNGSAKMTDRSKFKHEDEAVLSIVSLISISSEYIRSRTLLVDS